MRNRPDTKLPPVLHGGFCEINTKLSHLRCTQNHPVRSSVLYLQCRRLFFSEVFTTFATFQNCVSRNSAEFRL